MASPPRAPGDLADVPHPTRLGQWLGRAVLWASGWKLEGVDPIHPKFVCLAAPHTSNWDLLYLLAASAAMGLRVSWLGKSSLFAFPLGVLMRWLGGVPVDRTRHNNLVRQAVHLFQRGAGLILVVPPEGTRGKVELWKSGFYYIAEGANVPIGLGYLDYRRRRAGFKAFLQPRGELRRDMDLIRATYATVRGRHPERESEPRLKEELARQEPPTEVGKSPT